MVHIHVLDRQGNLVGPVEVPKLLLSDQEWRERLTPEQFGAEFGPDAEAVDRVTGWLQESGFRLGEVAAGPVYRLAGLKDLGTTNFPPVDTPLITGDLGFNYHILH